MWHWGAKDDFVRDDVVGRLADAAREPDEMAGLIGTLGKFDPKN